MTLVSCSEQQVGIGSLVVVFPGRGMPAATHKDETGNKRKSNVFVEHSALVLLMTTSRGYAMRREVL